MNVLQRAVCDVISQLVDEDKSRRPITLKEIVEKLPNNKPRNIRTAAESLCIKGYLRRGYSIKNNSCYILIRTNFT